MLGVVYQVWYIVPGVVYQVWCTRCGILYRVWCAGCVMWCPLCQVLEYLTTPDEEFITEERQQAFIELLDSGALSEIDEDRLLSMAEKAKL